MSEATSPLNPSLACIMRAMENSLLMASARSPVAPLFQFLFLSPLAANSEGVNFFDVYKELVNRNYDLGLYYHEKKYDLVAIYSLKEKWLVKSVVYDYKLREVSQDKAIGRYSNIPNALGGLDKLAKIIGGFDSGPLSKRLLPEATGGFLNLLRYFSNIVHERHRESSEWNQREETFSISSTLREVISLWYHATKRLVFGGKNLSGEIGKVEFITRWRKEPWNLFVSVLQELLSDNSFLEKFLNKAKTPSLLFEEAHFVREIGLMENLFLKIEASLPVNKAIDKGGAFWVIFPYPISVPGGDQGSELLGPSHILFHGKLVFFLEDIEDHISSMTISYIGNPRNIREVELPHPLPKIISIVPKDRVSVDKPKGFSVEQKLYGFDLKYPLLLAKLTPENGEIKEGFFVCKDIEIDEFSEIVPTSKSEFFTELAKFIKSARRRGIDPWIDYFLIRGHIQEELCIPVEVGRKEPYFKRTRSSSLASSILDMAMLLIERRKLWKRNNDNDGPSLEEIAVYPIKYTISQLKNLRENLYNIFEEVGLYLSIDVNLKISEISDDFLVTNNAVLSYGMVIGESGKFVAYVYDEFLYPKVVPETWR